MYTRPTYWDLGFQAIYIEPKNWAVCYNGEILQQEFASQRDAQDTAERWDREMTGELSKRDALRAGT